MNTPSKEALEAARDVRCEIQHPFGWQPIEDPEMAVIIDRHFEPLHRDNAALAGRLTAAELERDGLGARAEQAEARVKELELSLAAIGDIAVANWDDSTVGKVDAILKEPQRYKEKLRELFASSREAAALRADNAELQKQEAESRRLFYAEQDKRQSAEFRCEELAGALERALAQFAAMPEAKPHNDRDGVWHLWTDGCNILRAALASHDAGEPVAKYSFTAEPAKHPDTERIDWLESQPSKYDWGVTLDHGCVFAARNTTSGYSTLREAIDAARKP